MSKLREGSVIKVFGWVMLEGIESGKQYKIDSVFQHNGNDAYRFIKYPRGKKVFVAHRARDVDLWIGNPRDSNRIEIVNK